MKLNRMGEEWGCAGRKMIINKNTKITHEYAMTKQDCSLNGFTDEIKHSGTLKKNAAKC